jgi:hypothetical protein
MLKSNPSHNPEIVVKARATKEKNGTLHMWKGERGGNGKYTIPQIHLYEALGSGWVLEYPIPTGYNQKQGKGMYPTCYKVDLGYPQMKVAIEVDGPDHKLKNIALIDAKKVQLLETLGWKVLRFTNEDIMTNCSSIVSQVKNFLMTM